MCPIETKILVEKGKIAEVRRHGVFQTRVLKYLKKNNKFGFSQGDISKEFKTSEQQARLTLMALVKKGIVTREELPTTIESTKGTRQIFKIYYRHL